MQVARRTTCHPCWMCSCSAGGQIDDLLSTLDVLSLMDWYVNLQPHVHKLEALLATVGRHAPFVRLLAMRTGETHAQVLLPLLAPLSPRACCAPDVLIDSPSGPSRMLSFTTKGYDHKTPIRTSFEVEMLCLWCSTQVCAFVAQAVCSSENTALTQHCNAPCWPTPFRCCVLVNPGTVMHTAVQISRLRRNTQRSDVHRWRQTPWCTASKWLRCRASQANIAVPCTQWVCALLALTKLAKLLASGCNTQCCAVHR